MFLRSSDQVINFGTIIALMLSLPQNEKGHFISYLWESYSILHGQNLYSSFESVYNI